MDNPNENPEWMNKDFFTTVIRSYSGDARAMVDDFVIKPSLAVGEHYPSMIFRADINFSTNSKPAQSISVIVKYPRPSADQSMVLPLFDIEMDMYNGPLSEIEMLLKSVNESSNIQPKLIYQTKSPVAIIVLEDLGAKGYEKVSKLMNDYEAAKMVTRRLAKYHAASFFLMKDRKADFSRFQTSIFHIEADLIRKEMLDESFEVAADVLTTWPGFEDYATKLRDFKDTYLPKGRALYDPDVNGFNVLIHGDFHTRNLMFKKDGDKVIDCYFIDFQVPKVASPATDLFYVLYAIMDDEIRRKYRGEIVHEYHDEFSSMLTRFGYIGRIPSLLDLQMDLLRHGFMELVHLICFKIIFYVDNLHEVFGGGDSKKGKEKIFNDPRFRALLEAELPRLVHLGIL